MDLLTPVSNYLRDHATLSTTLQAIQNILVDAQLVVIVGYWFMKIDNFRLPFCLTVFGVSKMIMSVRIRLRRFCSGLGKYQIPLTSSHPFHRS